MASGDGPGDPSLQNWDPMLEDYESDFNSYDTGPGRDLPPNHQRPRRPEIGAGDMSASRPKTEDLIQLYITGIPNEMNNEGLSNLFSQAGTVVYAHKCAAANTNFDTAYGFVKFKTPDEASAAIAKFNNFTIQGKYRLRVSVALTTEQKAERAERRKRQVEFENSLSSANPCDSNDAAAPSSRVNGTPKNGSADGPTSGAALGRGLVKKVNASPGIPPSTASPQFNLSQDMGRGFLQYHPPSPGAVRGRVNGTPDTASVCGSDDGSVHTEGRRQVVRNRKPKGDCVICKVNKGTFHCSQCKETAYCGRECQKTDWPRHQLLCVKRSTQEKEFEKHFEVEIDCTPEEVHEHLLKQKMAADSACKLEDLARETLPHGTSTLVVVMDVAGPNNFCVVKDSMTPELQTLKDDMNLYYEDMVNVGPGSYMPVINEVCAARFKDDGEWYRVHVHRISLDATLDVTYIDFGNHEAINVTDIRRIEPHMLRLPLQAIRCSLGVVSPTDALEIENFNKLSSVMLTTDKKYMCQPLEVTAGAPVGLVQLRTLGANKDIADFFERFVSSPSSLSPRAMVPPSSRPTDPRSTTPKSRQFIQGSSAAKKGFPVMTILSPESTISLPNVSQSLPPVDMKTALRVRVLEVVTPGQFLVHFLEGVNELEKLPALHQSMTEYYGAMPPNTVFKIRPNCLYAAKFARDGLWYRALPYDPRSSCVHVQYLDYGTCESVLFSQVHPLEQRFCVLPQQAVCCALAGIQPKSDDWSEDAAIAFRNELLVVGGVATICSYKKVQNVLVVKLCRGLTPGGTTINELLLSRRLVIASSPDDAPGNESNEKQVLTLARKKVVESVAGSLEKQVGATKTSPLVRLEKKHSDEQLRSLKASQKPVPNASLKPASNASLKPASSPVKHKLPPTVAMLKCVKLPIDCDKLIVTTSTGPDDITVQFIEPDHNARVLSLTEALAKAHATYSGTYTPVNGELICAKFSEDNTWHRAEVIEVKGRGAGARVRFVDYGNADDVSASSMSALPEALLSYPVMGVKCQLTGVGTLAPGCQWDEGLLKPFQLWCVKLSGKEIAPCSVELFDNDTGVSLNAALASSASFVSVDSKKGVMKLRNVKIPERERIRIQVTDAVDADHVNVQILEDDYRVDFYLLTEELSRIEPAGGTVGYRPGDIVCAKYSLDNKWYRAIVLESTGDGIRVRFIDYGNMEMLSAGRIAPISDSLMKFPIMAVSCSLSGVDAVMSRDRWMGSLKLLEPMSMKVTGHGEGGRVIIELFDDASGPSLNEKLIATGVCTRAASSSVVMASSLGSMVLPPGDKLLKVHVVDASRGHEHVTVQILEGGFLVSLQDLTLTLAEKYADNSGGYQPSVVGELVCAKFSSDNAWYRAEVVKIGGKILVRFVDIGNTDEVCVDSIGKIDSVLLSHPILGLRCRLAGVGGPPQGSVWDEACLKPFHPLDMRVVNASAAVVSVELFDAGHSLNDQLVKVGILQSPVKASAGQKVISPAKTPMVKEMKAPSVERKSAPKVTVKDLKKTELITGQTSLVQVTSAPAPDSFTLQLLDNDSLLKLTTELLEYTGQSQGFNPSPGELVCARFSLDKNWYRAEVTAAAAGKYTVSFFDFGNEDTVAATDIGVMTPSLMQYPIMGVCCCLADVAGLVAGQPWEPDLLQPFQGLLMFVAGHKYGVPAVRLSDPKTQLDINADLIKRGVLAPVVSTPKTKTTSAVPPVVTIDGMKRIKLPSEEKMCVKVTDASRPGHITVQLLEKEYLDDLVSLTEVLIDTYSDYTDSYVPQVGEVVCAKFNGDWSRADVLALRPGRVASVRFFDFGNVEEINCGDIAKITHDAILRFPILGVSFRLGEAGPAWKPDSLVLFEAVLMTVVDPDSEAEPLVELFNVQTGISLIEELVKSGALLCAAQKVVMATKNDLKKVELPVDVGPVKVRVTDAYSPSSITVQVLQGDSLTQLKTLIDALINSFSHYSSSYTPQKGELVCVKFSQDDCWYRAEVLAVTPSGNIHVRFIDYGNSDEVTPESVAEVTPALCEYPVFGITCRLAGVVGVANSRVWDPTLVRPFELLTLTVESSEADGYAIKLYNDADCLNVSLVNSGMLVGQPAPKGTPVKPKDCNQNRSPMAPSTSEYVSMPLKSSPVSCALMTTPVVQPPSYMKCLPMQDLSRDHPLIMPCYLEGPDEFYVQSLDPDCAARFIELTQALTDRYGSVEAPAYEPKLKELVAAYCVNDNAWYRAIVTEFYGDTHYKVVFVDYGNADLVTVSGVQQLEPMFAKLPRQAVRVSLFGMNSTDVRWSGVAITVFSEEILNKACTMSVARKDGDVFIIADISIHGKSVIDKMVSDGYLELFDKAANGPSKPVNVNAAETVVKIGEIAIQQLSDADKVLLAHVVSPSEFSVLLTSNKAAIEMQVKLNDHCTKTTGAYMEFVCGEVVCALYDNVWYRSAVIETPSSGGLAKLCFFDFGNTERILPENIRRMPRHFASVPQQGIPCCLGYVTPAGQWSSKAVDWFAKLLNKCFKAKQLGYKDGRHHIDLRHDDQTCNSVSQEMISLQLAISVVAPGSQPTLAQRSNLLPVARKEVAPHSDREMYCRNDLPELRVTKEMEVVVVEVTSPGLFFCHQAKKASLEALASLLQQMDEHCNQLPVVVTFDPQPGEMCCALYQGDWYRAVVEKRQANRATIFFVDFGNLLTDDVTNLRPFTSQFCPLPQQAIKCSFAGLKPVGADWTPEATESFKSLVATGNSPIRLYMVVVERNSGSLSVKLVDTTGDDVNGKDIGTQLVARGMAASKNKQASDSKPAAASSVEDKNARRLTEENAKLKQELDELRRMMQQQKL